MLQHQSQFEHIEIFIVFILTADDLLLIDTMERYVKRGNGMRGQHVISVQFITGLKTRRDKP